MAGGLPESWIVDQASQGSHPGTDYGGGYWDSPFGGETYSLWVSLGSIPCFGEAPCRRGLSRGTGSSSAVHSCSAVASAVGSLPATEAAAHLFVADSVACSPKPSASVNRSLRLLFKDRQFENVGKRERGYTYRWVREPVFIKLCVYRWGLSLPLVMVSPHL